MMQKRDCMIGSVKSEIETSSQVSPDIINFFKVVECLKVHKADVLLHADFVICLTNFLFLGEALQTSCLASSLPR